MGLCERVIRATGGTVNIFKMMERTAQSKNVVRLGLEYLQALGRIQVEFGERTRVDVAYGDKLPAPPADLAALENRFGIASESLIQNDKITQYANLGLVWKDGERIGITPDGMPLLDALLGELVADELVAG